MTIASEISRLQGAKACLKASLEAKGVSVPSDLTLEGYYECVDEMDVVLPKYIDYIVVGGGGGGACGIYEYGVYSRYAGGGGGGEILQGNLKFSSNLSITIGSGGTQNCGGLNSIIDLGSNCITARGGCPGVLGTGKTGGNSGSGYTGAGPTYSYGGGGGGACGCATSRGGGLGFNGMGGGGNGGGYTCAGVCGGGSGGSMASGICRGCDATGCGGGGGGGAFGCKFGNGPGGNGGGGLVVICYKTDGSCGINTATGGTITTEGDYTIHCFTTDGTFTVVN